MLQAEQTTARLKALKECIRQVNVRGHVTVSTPTPSLCGTVPGNMLVKFEVRSFNYIGLRPGSAICADCQTRIRSHGAYTV